MGESIARVMETFSGLLAICVPVTGVFPHKGPVTQSLCVFLLLARTNCCANKTQWRSCNITVIDNPIHPLLIHPCLFNRLGRNLYWILDANFEKLIICKLWSDKLWYIAVQHNTLFPRNTTRKGPTLVKLWSNKNTPYPWREKNNRDISRAHCSPKIRQLVDYFTEELSYTKSA